MNTKTTTTKTALPYNMHSPESKEKYRMDALDTLRAALPPGSTVTTYQSHRTASGTRCIVPLCIMDGKIWDISNLAARITGYKYSQKHGGVETGHEGGDALVMAIARALYPDGFECIGDAGPDSRHRCPSNDHYNGDRDFTPHHHKSGEYALHAVCL